MAEEEESLEAEIVYPITCGDSRANLIWRKFVCPGINVKCVQVRVPMQPGCREGLPGLQLQSKQKETPMAGL